MEQSSVEFLVEKLKSQGLLIGEPENLVAVREAKEMFEQQIIDSFNQDLYGGLNGNKKFDDGKQYFNQTFRKI